MSAEPSLKKKRLVLIGLVAAVLALAGGAVVFSLINPASPKPKSANPTATYNQAVELCKAYAGTAKHSECMSAYGW